LKAGIVSESMGPWASLVVLVRKKYGDSRFFVDFSRKVNGLAKKDVFALPRIDDLLDWLGVRGEGVRRCCFFSILDTKVILADSYGF